VFDWLFEGRLTVYLFLAAVALAFAGLYWRTHKRYWLFPAGAFVLLAAPYFLLDRLVETRSEQITRKLGAMAAAVQRRDADAIFRHIAADFRVAGLDRATFRNYVEAAFNRGVTGLKVWDFQFTDDSGGVAFFAKPEGTAAGANAHYLVRARFVQEGGEWRLQTFQVFNPLVNTNTPLELPALPR
jgi:hypothetical protein